MSGDMECPCGHHYDYHGTEGCFPACGCRRPGEAWTPATQATVILFNPSGKYYTEEQWRIPEAAIGPYDMDRSPDFRRINGGAVLVETQEPWGFPHLFPGVVR